MVHVNGKKVGGNDAVTKFTAYVSPYFVVSNGGAYTKHIYAASQRIASKLGNIDGFGADPRRVEQAGGKKYDDKQSETIKARFEALHIDYSDGNGKKDDEEYEPTMDSEEKENLVFFYHPDHLGSTSYVTDADGNIAQHVEYIPYGEVFVEERNNSFSTNYLFNAKELDNETGLYYYGARYLDPTGAMWLSVDPVFHAGTSPYAYCLGNPVKMVDPDGRKVLFPNGMNMTDRQTAIGMIFAYYHDNPNMTTIVTHGDKFSMQFNGLNIIYPRDVYNYLIDNSPVFNNKESEIIEGSGIRSIVLFHSCSTGAGELNIQTECSESEYFKNTLIVAPTGDILGSGSDISTGYKCEIGIFVKGKENEAVNEDPGNWSLKLNGKQIGTIPGTETPSFENIEKVVKEYINTNKEVE